MASPAGGGRLMRAGEGSRARPAEVRKPPIVLLSLQTVQTQWKRLLCACLRMQFDCIYCACVWEW
jgi:hypothetical protein